MSSKRFHLNVAGPFYVEDGTCITCGAPEAEAPTLMAHADGDYPHCYFARQPETPEELEQAIAAVQVSCCGGVRYGGDDLEILRRLRATLPTPDRRAVTKRDPGSVGSRTRGMEPTVTPRYRQENGRTVVELRVRMAQQLFDGRDPAPFRERDLDANAAQYIVDAADELGPGVALRIVVHLAEPPPAELGVDAIAAAITSHFRWQRERIVRELARHFRRSRVVLLLGFVLLAAFLALSELTSYLPESGLRDVLSEGLVIIGWVSIWRPLELLLYDWWPMATRRRLLDRILAAEIDVRPAASE